MGKQLLGTLLIFVVVVGVAGLETMNESLKGEAGGQRFVWIAIRGITSMILFGILFAGLRIFAAGLNQEWSAQANQHPRDHTTSP